jgi:hypothetical protein
MTRDKFKAYEKVRQSGKTNMFYVSMVIKLSKNKLTREDILDIWKHYQEYLKGFKNKEVNEIFVDDPAKVK